MIDVAGNERALELDAIVGAINGNLEILGNAEMSIAERLRESRLMGADWARMSIVDAYSPSTSAVLIQTHGSGSFGNQKLDMLVRYDVRNFGAADSSLGEPLYSRAREAGLMAVATALGDPLSMLEAVPTTHAH